MLDDRHRGLKRWERAKQLAGLDADPDLVGPLAWCRVQTQVLPGDRGETPVEKVKVYILRVFTKDLVCVHAYREPVPAGIPGPCWLVRGGIEWAEYLREVVRHYQSGLSVCEPFRARRKISPEILFKLNALPDRDLPLVFEKLRDSGFLPNLPVLDRLSCPTALTWDNLRANFQDFHMAAEIKDSPPL
jgi:hypothetical protein